MISLAWKIGGFSLVLVLVLAPLCFGAYQLGHNHAEAKGKAALAALQADYSEERRAVSDAYGTALADTLENYQREVSRATDIERKLTTAQRTLAATETQLRRQIAHVTSGSTHTFSLEFVRMFNKALGAGITGALSVSGDTGDAPGAGRPGAASGAGLLATAGVTEADMLAFMVYYGGRCQRLEKKERAWIGLAEGW